jgi:class 3 adenylate cyclase
MANLIDTQLHTLSSAAFGGSGLRSSAASSALRDVGHGERREVVVLSADMRGFTQNSQILPPDTVLAMLDVFFSGMDAVIACNDGVMVSMQGDTLLAAFGTAGPAAAQQQTQTLCDAISCAHQMQTSFQAIADEWAEKFGIRAALGIGLNRGEAVLGLAGTPAQRTGMVFGECVELATRFMHRARAGEIVFSAAVKQAMQDNCTVTDTEALPDLVVGGRDPIALYGVTIETRLDFT